MAWPLTPLTTYIANSTPAIKANDLNLIQSAVNDLFNGAKTVKQFEADGTGGNASTVGSGLIKAANGFYATSGGGSGNALEAIAGDIVADSGYLSSLLSRQGTAAPTPTVALGKMCKEMIPIGWAYVIGANGSVSLARGCNVKSVTQAANGNYTITFNAAPPNPTQACIMITEWSNAGGGAAGQPGAEGLAEAVTGNLQAHVTFPAAAIAQFMIIVWSA